MVNYTQRFLKYLLGLRGAETGLTDAEMQYIAYLAVGKKCIVKLGVEEGVDSVVICQHMEPDTKLYLVDSFLRLVRLEKLFNISFAEYITKRTVKSYSNLIQFVKIHSLEAVEYLKLELQPDFIFINNSHQYASVVEEFRSCASILSPQGIIAFPYSRTCKDKPGLNPKSGALQLCNEIARGEHGNWEIVNTFEWITVIATNSNRQVLIQ